MVVVLSDHASDSNWQGILLPVERSHHSGLMREFPLLVPHSVLGKWLFARESHEEFETVSRIIESIASGDQRFGIEPMARKRKRKVKRKQRIRRGES
jgi:hypothetical protein